MKWLTIKQWLEQIVDHIGVALLVVIGIACSIMWGGVILALVCGLLLLVFAGKAIALLCVLTIAVAIASLIFYQDLSLFTAISNYFSQLL